MGDGRLVGILVAILVTLASACLKHEGGTNVLIPRYPDAYKAYNGDPLPLTELAVIETAVGHSAREAGAMIRTIDGLYMRGFMDGKVQVHVQPGSHTFGLAFAENGIVLGAKNFKPHASITFDAEAGHSYRIYGRQQRVKGSIEGGRATVYVVDVATGARVAG